MIKYDYTIERDEGDKIRTYSPNLIPTELADVVYIQGPNSSGKSTLLNLIALGFFGDKLDENQIDPSLRERINNLKNSKHQNIKFNFEIRNEKLALILKSEKKDLGTKDISVYKISGGKEIPISHNNFIKEYKLIYDIPTDPLRRLPGLLNEIEHIQNIYASQINDLNNYIRQLINDIKEARDPNKIELIQKDIGESISEHDSKKNDLDLIRGKHKKLNDLYLSKFYLETQSALTKIEIDLSDLRKIKSKIKTTEKKQSKEGDILREQIKVQRKKAEEYYEKCITLLKILIPVEEKHRLLKLEKSSCSEEILNNEIFHSIRNESKALINIFNDIIKDDPEINSSEVKLLQALVSALGDFKNSDLVIPGTNQKIDDFIKMLDSKLETYKSVLVRKENISELLGNLKNLSYHLEEAIRFTSQCKKVNKDQKEIIQVISKGNMDDELNEMAEKKDFLESKLNSFKIKLHKADISEENAKGVWQKLLLDKEIKTYDAFLESQLLDSCNHYKTVGDEQAKEVENIAKRISFKLEEVKRIEKKEPHELQNYLQKLISLQEVTLRLSKKFSPTFKNYLIKIKSSSSDTSFTTEEKNYSQMIAEYLALKINLLRHGDQILKVKRIDFINKHIITYPENREEGQKFERIIRFDDLGTGQSQSAYLEGLLSINEDKKIIALFDEVAMMDSQSLEPIFNKLKELYEKKKLLFGIIVQKADDVKIKSIV